MTLVLQNKLLLFFGFVFFCVIWADASNSSFSSLKVTDQDIKQCLAVQKLDELHHEIEEGESPIMRTIFGYLFPFGPAWNSILGTFYISSYVPHQCFELLIKLMNLIYHAFIPAKINGDTLNTMTAFAASCFHIATGGLLSDVFLHLVPHSFMGEHQDSGAHFIMVEEKRNILTGLGIFLGFAAFFFMEKTLRVLSGEDDEGGSSSHTHSHSHSMDEKATARSSAISEGTLKSRANTGTNATSEGPVAEPEPRAHVSTNGPSKLSAYLNLFGDFVHNITDGLARLKIILVFYFIPHIPHIPHALATWAVYRMAASFYASPLIGATTTLACFAHEIPHEIADYSILIRSGFTKRQAMQSQFLTAIGAFQVGTFIGIAVRNAAVSSNDEKGAHAVDFAGGIRQDANGLLGTTLQIADLVNMLCLSLDSFTKPRELC
ncbi:hypothetical protein D9757_002524 [Collybiopsis confluens]|uniref:Uncharacterized protein n=1 Tax=Collybiopsis confluens TaxID=2823264 RepID=A0A8H5HXY1_9AGAR|nr:hypothetical protein D9757_002524 [Collybiopsis confluens]